jgi:hypothetical protein
MKDGRNRYGGVQRVDGYGVEMLEPVIETHGAVVDKDAVNFGVGNTQGLDRILDSLSFAETVPDRAIAVSGDNRSCRPPRN